MADDLRDLYQEVILEHARKPRNFRAIATPGVRRAQGFNRLCGDRLNVYLEIAAGIVRDASFEGSGCAISTASASMMTQAVKGKTEAEVEALFERFHSLVTTGEPGQGTSTTGEPGEGTSTTGEPGEGTSTTGEPAGGPPAVDLGKLEIFAGVHEFPARVKCATLAWHTLRAALGTEIDAVVSTEE